MLKILLIIENEKEEKVLKAFFEQASFKVNLNDACSINWVSLEQEIPDILLLEIPQKIMKPVSIMRIIRKNKKLNKIPIIAYGNHTDETVIKGFNLDGANNYLHRPLNTAALMENIKRLTGTSEKKDNAAIVSKILNKAYAIYSREKETEEPFNEGI